MPLTQFGPLKSTAWTSNEPTLPGLAGVGNVAHVLIRVTDPPFVRAAPTF